MLDGLFLSSSFEQVGTSLTLSLNMHAQELSFKVSAHWANHGSWWQAQTTLVFLSVWGGGKASSGESTHSSRPAFYIIIPCTFPSCLHASQVRDMTSITSSDSAIPDARTLPTRVSKACERCRRNKSRVSPLIHLLNYSGYYRVSH
jgi:hypothetical protein